MIVAAAIICAFALYGAARAAARLTAYFRENGPAHALSEELVLFVRNQEETVEGIVRCAAWRVLSGEMSDGITVVDLGSEDATFEILMRLQNEYDFVSAVKRERYIEKIQEM